MYTSVAVNAIQAPAKVDGWGLLPNGDPAMTTAIPADAYGVFVIPSSGATAWTKNLSDTITLSDAVTKTIGALKTDTITLTELIAKAVTALRADTVTLSDAIAKLIGATKSDTITLSDARAMAAAVAKSDTITLSDIFSSVPPPGAATTVAPGTILLNRFGIY